METQGISRGRGRNPNRAPASSKPSPFQEYEVHSAKTPTGSPPPLSSYFLPTSDSLNTMEEIYAFQDIVPFQKSPVANKPQSTIKDVNNNSIDVNNNNIKPSNTYGNKYNAYNIQTNDRNASNFNANINNHNNNRFKYNKQGSFHKKLPSTWGTLGTALQDDEDDDTCPTCDRLDKTVFCTTCGHNWKVCGIDF